MGEYKDSLNLPKTEMPMRASLATREPQWLEVWANSDLYQLSLLKNQGKTPFYLHDGPPYPNGNIHAGHALNKILKDIVLKYKTMKGFFTPFRPGWDCHGLPIETQLLKELKDNKERIPEKEEFRLRCQDYALKYVNIQKTQFQRLGIRADWDNPYLTLSPEYESQVYKVFNKLRSDGYIYQGRKPIHWCPNCVTALAEAEIEYADHKSPSVFIAFHTINNSLDFEAISILVWTTTPWTLPANVAIATHPDFDYAIIKYQEKFWLMAHDLVETVTDQLGWTGYQLIKTVKGKELLGTVCKHPFYERTAPLVLADYVTAEDGTGFVHIAPGHGQEDYLVGKKYDLPMIMPVDDQGILTEEAGIFAGLKYSEANKAIISYMEENQTSLKLIWA